MKIKFDALWLSDEFAADGFLTGLSVGGRQIVQEADFIRAARKQLFSRLNRATSIQFSVLRVFDTSPDCENFLLNHYAALSDGPADLTCRLGAPVSTDVIFANTVLESLSISPPVGSTCRITYSFRTPGLASTAVPQDDVVTGLVSISNGVDTQTFTGLGLSSAPSRVTGSVVVPTSGSDIIWGTIVDASWTTDGFTIVLSAVTPNGNYKFSYAATLS